MAKEMANSGDWTHLRLAGSLQFDKPPLLIWITALFYKIWGVSELTSRAFSSLCGLGVVLVTYFFGRQLLNRWMGFLAAMVLLTTSHFIHTSRMAMPDIPFTFFITLALYFFWRGFQRNRFFIFSGVAIGLAVMTIGFEAFFIFPVIWIYLLLSGRHDIFNRSTYWVGVIIAALIGLPWHLYQMVVFKDMLWRTVDWQFFASPRVWLGGEFFYYIKVLVNKDHPWILFAFFSAPFFVFKSIKEKEDESIFLSVWIFATLIFLSFLRVKRFEYLVPLYPALSITVSYWLGKLFRDHAVMWVRIIMVVILALHVPYSHIFDADGSRDVKAMAQAVKARVKPFGKVYLYRYNEAPGVIFYMSRVAAQLDHPVDFEKKSKEAGFYCLLRRKDLSVLGGDEALSRLGLTLLGSSGELSFVGPKT